MTLFEQLQYVGGVRPTGFNHSRPIKEALWSNKATCIKAEWASHWDREWEKPLNLDKLEDDRAHRSPWSTYDKCVDIYLTTKKTKVVCEVTIWDGDMMDGYPTNKRWSGTFHLQRSVLKSFKDTISRNIKSVLDQEYRKYLEDKKRLWIEDRRNAIGL